MKNIIRIHWINDLCQLSSLRDAIFNSPLNQKTRKKQENKTMWCSEKAETEKPKEAHKNANKIIFPQNRRH